MAGQTLEHTGAAIVEEYYPQYAEVRNPVYPLYSDLVYIGSTIILLSMCMLGLPITALGYALDTEHMSSPVSMSLAVIAVVANIVVFLVGLGMCMAGFKRHKRPDEHH